MRGMAIRPHARFSQQHAVEEAMLSPTIALAAEPSLWPLGSANGPFHSSEDREALVAFLNSGVLAERILADRTARLAAFSAELGGRNLKTFAEPNQLGDAGKRGQLEIVGLYGLWSCDPRFHWDVVTIVQDENGKYETRPMRWNANSKVADGGVCVVVIQWAGETYFLLTHQWRQQLGRYTVEVARGYAELEDLGAVLDAGGSLLDPRFEGMKGVRTLLREAGQELGDPDVLLNGLKLRHYLPLPSIANNTGTDTAVPNFFQLVLEARDGADRRGREALEKLFHPREKEHRPILWTADRVRTQIGGLLCDNHTLAALLATAATSAQMLGNKIVF